MNLTKKYLKQLVLEAFEELEEKNDKKARKALMKSLGKGLPKSTPKRTKEIFGTDTEPPPRKAGEFKGSEDQPKINRGDDAAELAPLPKSMEKHTKLLPVGKIKLSKKRKERTVTLPKSMSPPKKKDI